MSTGSDRMRLGLGGWGMRQGLGHRAVCASWAATGQQGPGHTPLNKCVLPVLCLLCSFKISKKIPGGLGQTVEKATKGGFFSRKK